MNPDTSSTTPLLRHLPSVDQVIRDPEIQLLTRGLSPEIVARLIRHELNGLRDQLLGNPTVNGSLSEGTAVRRAAFGACSGTLSALRQPQLSPAINATGIIIHTGMGRSPLADEALEAVRAVSEGYCDVAISRESGGRRSRSSGVDVLLRALTGCESAVVTNNNAAATMLALHTLAREKEVIVSRGQLVEIGGSFRLPEVMTSAGARLREVGTTNRTRIRDYADAINEQTGAIMRIHPSNFQIVGFTESVPITELVELGRHRGVPVIDDIGSGALVDFETWGLKGEMPAQDSVAAGADLVLFSGDKLLGGPQAGIVVGRRTAVQRCASNPLMRALRVDKMTIAALEATLRLYLDPEALTQRLPLLRLISEPMDALRLRADSFLSHLNSAGIESPACAEVSSAFVGGGSLPGMELPSIAVVIEVAPERAEALKRALRLGEPSVFCRVRRDQLEFDMRTLRPGDIGPLGDAVTLALASPI